MVDEVAAIVDDLGAELDRSIVVEDSRMRLIAFSPHHGAFDAIRERSVLTRETPAEAVEWLSDLGVFESHVPIRVAARPEIGAESRVMVPIRLDGDLVGFLAVLDPEAALDEEQVARCDDIARRLAGLLQRMQLLEQGVSARERELVDALLFAAQPAARARAADDLVDAALLKAGALLVVVVAPPGTPRGAAVDRDLRLSQLVLRAKRGLRHDAIAATTVDDHCVLVVSVDARSDDADPALRVHGALAGAPPPSSGAQRTVIAYGNRAPHGADAARAYRQAALAATVARGMESLGPVVGWAQLGVYQLLAQLPSGGFEDTDADARLRVLLDRPELVHTIETYLDLAGDAKRTAELLNLHRASLYHRLNRVEEILRVDLKNGEERLALHLALKALRLRRVLR